MTQEQPLVSIGEIAKHLSCSKDTARRVLKTYKVPSFLIGRCIAIYPSSLKICLEHTNRVLTRSDSILNRPESEGSST